MPMYVALLRGINLAGRNRVSMVDLRRIVAALGHTDVATYLQSGNVVFAGAEPDTAKIVQDLEGRLAAELGLHITVLLRSGAQLARLPAANPFAAAEDDLTKLHVTFLAAEPAAPEEFAAPAGEPARFAIVGREVFLHCPQGYGRSKLSNAYIERKLKVAATTRNWKTTTKLREMTAAP
jgi:uncharacterized protein (DUF1697 family)